MSSSFAFYLIIQLIITLVLEVDASVFRHLILTTNFASLLDTGHLSIAIRSDSTARAILVRNTISLIFDIFIQLLSSVVVLVVLEIRFGLLRRELSRGRGFRIPI